MAGQIKITFPNIGKVVEKMDKFSLQLMGQLNSAVKDISDTAKAAMIDESPQATGELKESVTATITTTGRGIKAEITPSAGYAYYVEKGRSAGGPPPVDKIQTWLAAKGLDPKSAYLVSRKIGRTGTQANPFTKRAFDRIKSGVNKRITSAVTLTLRGVFK